MDWINRDDGLPSHRIDGVFDQTYKRGEEITHGTVDQFNILSPSIDRGVKNW